MRSLLKLVFVFVTGFALFPNLAKADEVFRLVSQQSGKCISLLAADQSDGGRLVMRDCKNFPDFFITSKGGRVTPLHFELNSARFICIFSTETPTLATPRDKVEVRNCGSLVSSLWNLRGDLAGVITIEKLKGLDSTSHCMRENDQTGEIELDLCQNVSAQQWTRERLTLPPTD
ncbi:MAG: hypothetical protein H7Y08_00025 [Rhizobiaceae bacterium]|nr:hypothetical protein [Rhizobiaceae bacterium]